MNTVMKLLAVGAMMLMPMGMMADDDRPYHRGMMGPGYGQGGGYGMGPGYGRGGMQPCEDCGTYHRRGYGDKAEPLTEKDAKAKFEAHLENHLKGYSITKTGKQEMPMGTMFWVIIKDKNGNEMELHMNPWGYIRGPFVR